jgi:hypothetical protein
MVSSKRISAVFAGHRSGDSIKGRFVQLLNGLPLTLYRGLPQLNRPQTPVPPLPYTTEEVTFTNPDAGATFAGTLTYPIGYRARRQKKVPVVLMVSGSGQQNRDEELMGHQPFRVIADYLARHGIASLRYDDRGTGQSVGGRIDSVTTADFAQDALYGLRHLRQRGFKHVGVLGHSEGGNIAFIAGARGEADFLISLAGAGVKGDTALTAQYNRTMELSGQPGRKSTAQYVASVKGKGQPWLDYFLDYDPSDDLAAIHCPVMAVNGDKDCQVLWELNLEGIQRHLPKNKRNIIKSYSDLNHLFQHCTTGAPTEYRQIEETFSVEVLDDIVQFIHQACKER